MQFVQSTLRNINLWQYVVWKLENTLEWITKKLTNEGEKLYIKTTKQHRKRENNQIILLIKN